MQQCSLMSIYIYNNGMMTILCASLIYFLLALISFRAFAWLTVILGALWSFNYKAYSFLLVALCMPGSYIIKSFIGPLLPQVVFVPSSGLLLTQLCY